ncbi:MAG: DNA polymerase III subunit beta [Bacteroidales bacterium]
MRFIINSQILLKNLQSIGGVVVTNNALPILGNYLFILKEKELTLVGSDLETTMMVSMSLEEASQEGRVAIPSKILMETLKTFPDIPLIFNIDAENFGVEITAGDGKYKLAGENPESYPEIPMAEGSVVKTEISSSVLVNAISKTLFATGNDSLRPVMSGVFFELTPENLTFVATDAHKLVRYRRMDAKSEHTGSFIVPKKSLLQIKNILSGRKEEISISLEYNETNVFFSFEQVRAVCRLIDGKYPNYEAVIPTENPNKLNIDRLTFLNCIRRVSIYANQSVPQARLKFNGKELIVTAEDVDCANEAKERLLCQYEGEPMEIGFNSKFFMEMLSNIDTEEVCVEMSQPSRAGLILPVGNPNEKEDILMLVMPVML